MLISSLVAQCVATMNVVHPFLATLGSTNWSKFNDFETASHYIYIFFGDVHSQKPRIKRQTVSGEKRQNQMVVFVLHIIYFEA